MMSKMQSCYMSQMTHTDMKLWKNSVNYNSITECVIQYALLYKMISPIMQSVSNNTQIKGKVVAQ